MVAGAAAFFLNRGQEPEGHSMAPPDTTSIAIGAPIQQVSEPTEYSNDAQIGKRAFEVKCAVCHGENAAGTNGTAPPLIHKTYEPGHHGDMSFLMAVENGVQSHHWGFGNMPPISGLSRGEVKYIVAYVRELQRENGIN